MSTHSAVLTDVGEGVWSDRFELRESADLRLAGSSNWAIRKRTLRGGLSDGVDVVELDNGTLSVSILPTRGMGLWRGHCRGLDLGWDSPVRLPVHPSNVNQTERSGLGWLCGFNELLCRCGLSSNGEPGPDVVIDGAGHKTETALTLHGKIANTPAHRVAVAVTSDHAGLLSVSGVVDEAMMFGPHLRLTTTYETAAGSNRLTIRDEVVNLGGHPAELQLLYHMNFGRPLLEEGSRLSLPIREVAPRDKRAAEDIATWQSYLGPTAGYVEQCYYVDLIADEHDQTAVLLRNKSGDRGVSLHFSRRELPCFTVWKCSQAEGDGYVTGLEPATNLPNHKSFERKRGRVPILAPGESHRAQINLVVHSTSAEIAEAEKKIAALQNRAHPVVHPQPIAKYSPVS